MRLLLVSAYGDDVRHGGAEHTIKLLADELATRGHEIRFLRAFPGEGALGPQTTVLHRADWKESGSRRLANHLNDFVSRPSRSLTAAVVRHRPDLVHTHNLVGIGTGIWEVARRAGVPVVHTLHDYHLLCPRVTLMDRSGRPCRPSPLLCGLRSRRLLRHANAVSVLVGPSQRVLRAHEGLFPRASQHLARNPVPEAETRPLRPPSVPPRSIGYIGSLDTIKGVGLLLEALPELVELGYELHFAGDGRLRDAVTRVSGSRQGLSYHGYVAGEEKTGFLASCDVGVVPSLWAEPGAPNYSMLDWLSAGRPVVVSRRGGLAEIADESPGSIAVEPTAEEIVATFARLREAKTWQALLAAVRPARTGTVSEYADLHERLYGSALA